MPLSKFEDEMGSSMIKNLLEFWLIHEQGFALFLYDTSFTLEWFFVYAYLCMLTVNHEQLNPRNDNYAANLLARFIFVQYQDFWKLSYVAL